MQIRLWELQSMLALGLDRTAYGLLSVKERTIYVIRDHLNDWFQALSDHAKLKEMKANAKRNEGRKAPAKTSHY